MPDFAVQHIKYYSKKEAKLNDFNGKWLLLDFWNKGCGACVASFPHINEIQKNFGDRIQVILVGIQDKEGQIEKLYDKYRKLENLILPCAFDSNLSNQWGIYSAPHSILIDDKGIVQCVTISLGSNDIKDFLAGKNPFSTNSTITHHYEFDSEKPFLVNDNGGKDTDFVFRSMLSIWNKNTQEQYTPSSVNDDIKKGQFQVLGVPLTFLFNYAYFGCGSWRYADTFRYGKVYNDPILELVDSSIFNYSYKYNRNVFSYSFIMPPALCKENTIKSTLQRDLDTYFNLESHLEMRKCPYWKIVVRDNIALEKIKSKGGHTNWQYPVDVGFVGHNCPFRKAMEWIWYKNPESIILDETGITDNLDITLDCIATNMDDLKRALRLNGLDLVLAQKDMQVIVIRDKNRLTAGN